MKTPIIAAALVFGFAFNSIAQAPAPVKPKSEVNQRQQNQRARIRQGEASGELTRKEARNLKKDEKAIHTEVKAERAANGGRLTPEERKQVNRQQNQESKKIYDKKHNARVK